MVYEVLCDGSYDVADKLLTTKDAYCHENGFCCAILDKIDFNAQ